VDPRPSSGSLSLRPPRSGAKGGTAVTRRYSSHRDHLHFSFALHSSRARIFVKNVFVRKKKKKKKKKKKSAPPVSSSDQPAIFSDPFFRFSPPRAAAHSLFVPRAASRCCMRAIRGIASSTVKGEVITRVSVVPTSLLPDLSPRSRRGQSRAVPCAIEVTIHDEISDRATGGVGAQKEKGRQVGWIARGLET